MKTVSDFIQLLESEGAVNTMGSGAIATVEPPIGAVQKRKKPATVESLSVDTTNVDPLSNVYAKPTPDDVLTPVAADDDEQKKKFFHQKQQYQLDQISSA